MNEWCIYIALYCVLLYTQSALPSRGGGVSPQPPPVYSIHLDDATAATGQRRQCAHHTPATLLDFAVILQLLTVKKYSKIPYIWFTVNYCNTHCIMGISVLILQ